MYHKLKMLLLFSGFRMSTRSLQRYASLYNMPCYTIPFDVKNLWIEPDFDDLKDVMETDKLHVHCLSGGVLQYSRLLNKHEVLKKKGGIRIL